MAQQSPTIQPEACDILCGKDRACVNHAGSRRFRHVIESYREKYQQALTKYDKMPIGWLNDTQMMITKEIYESISPTSRFLKYNEKDKSWEEISPLAARDKVGHALRFANRGTRKKDKKSHETEGLGSRRSSTRPSTAPSSIAATPPLPTGTIMCHQPAQDDHRLFNALMNQFGPSTMWNAIHVPSSLGGPVQVRASASIPSSSFVPSVSGSTGFNTIRDAQRSALPQNITRTTGAGVPTIAENFPFLSAPSYGWQRSGTDESHLYPHRL